jgi:hypothetical protein
MSNTKTKDKKSVTGLPEIDLFVTKFGYNAAGQKIVGITQSELRKLTLIQAWEFINRYQTEIITPDYANIFVTEERDGREVMTVLSPDQYKIINETCFQGNNDKTKYELFRAALCGRCPFCTVDNICCRPVCIKAAAIRLSAAIYEVSHLRDLVIIKGTGSEITRIHREYGKTTVFPQTYQQFVSDPSPLF